MRPAVAVEVPDQAVLPMWHEGVCDLLCPIETGGAMSSWTRRIDRRVIGALAASTLFTLLLVAPYLYRAF